MTHGTFADAHATARAATTAVPIINCRRLAAAMPTAVLRILYVLENDALLVNAEKRNWPLKENFYLAASRRFSLFVSFYRGSAKGRRMQVGWVKIGDF